MRPSGSWTVSLRAVSHGLRMMYSLSIIFQCIFVKSSLCFMVSMFSSNTIAPLLSPIRARCPVLLTKLQVFPDNRTLLDPKQVAMFQPHTKIPLRITSKRDLMCSGRESNYICISISYASYKRICKRLKKIFNFLLATLLST